jgi:hypothetical protein
VLQFPLPISYHRLLHTYHHLSSMAGTVGQLEADVPSGLSLTPPKETKKCGKNGCLSVHTDAASSIKGVTSGKTSTPVLKNSFYGPDPSFSFLFFFFALMTRCKRV